MDSLELKVPKETLDDHLRKVRIYSQEDKHEPIRRAKRNKASDEEKTISVSNKELNELQTRQNKWSQDQDYRPGAKQKGSKYTSNKTHYSPVDPDAKISVKPGQPRKLNFYAQMAVDTENHVITHIQAAKAHKKDSQYLQEIVKNTASTLNHFGLCFENVLADAGYSPGENYAFLEEQNIAAYTI